jgi:hypothetical protein
MHIARLALAAALALAAVPATALAAPDHTGSVDATKSKFEWDSKLGTGFVAISTIKPKVPCGTAAVHDCDETLIHVTGCGSLAVTNASSDPNAVDTDLYTYYSNANGDIVDTGPSSAQGTPTPDESVSVDTPDQGTWILVEIDYAVNLAGTVHGVATFTPNDPIENPDFCTAPTAG